MTHTPGPWKVDGSFVYALEPAKWLGNSTFQNRFWASVQAPSSTPSDEIYANAHLIASAPDLLDALEKLAHLHSCEQEGLLSGRPTAAQWYEAVEEASNAIKKAKGL